MASPTGLYVHVPYCRSICPYCDFNVYLAGRQPPFEALAQSMGHEMAARAHAYRGPLTSLYFGGGTPSLAPVTVLLGLLERARATFGLLPTAEVTLEADPGTVDGTSLAALRAGGVNRLSIGWQSSHDALLRTLGRPHDRQAGIEAVALARAAGFDNISLDLIFAVPGQTLDHLEADLDALLALKPSHVSLYALTYHSGTPMARRLAKGTLQKADEELELAMMARIDERLTAAGFDHYEISNFAKPKAQAVHNSLYWAYHSYLGIGPGAHSFWRNGSLSAHRWGNLRAPTAYMERWQSPVRAPTPPQTSTDVAFVETLGPQQMVLEQMMVGLRLQQGLALTPVRACARQASALPVFEKRVQQLVARGWARLEGDRLVPTATGRDLCDSAAELFVG
jgi:oxygen-independent coproporphyrinogen-3 oxidase